MAVATPQGQAAQEILVSMMFCVRTPPTLQISLVFASLNGPVCSALQGFHANGDFWTLRATHVTTVPLVQTVQTISISRVTVPPVGKELTAKKTFRVTQIRV